MTRSRTPARILVLLVLWLAACGLPFGIYHEVGRGETLFRIARTYNVPVQELVDINRISDPSKLRRGQMIFIPGASKRKQVDTAPTAPAAARPAAAASKVPDSSEPVRSTTSPNAPPPRPSKPSLSPVGGPAPKFRWPVSGTLTSHFGTRDGGAHDGIDVGAPEGTAIVAAADGSVIYAGDGLRGYGNLIILKHSGGYSTIYAHNRSNRVRKGAYVAAGETIAEVGQTGRASAPHLHFEVREGKKPVDPLQYLPNR